jgi:hypothetical protein
MFEAFEYVQDAQKVGITKEHAEFDAEQMNKLVKRLVSKKFLGSKLKELEMKMTIKVGAMMFVQTGLILTIIGLLIRR